MRRNILLAAGVFSILICAQSVRAEMFSFSKSMGGTISDVRPDAISLTPSSPRNGNTSVDLEINDSTKLKNIQTVNELKPGDTIQVRYKEQDGKKIAVQVEKNSQGQSGTTADTATTGSNAAMATGSSASSSPTRDVNTMGSKNTAEDQLYKTNQGTNVAPANRQTPGIDQSGSESSSQFQAGSSQQDQINQGSTTTSTESTTGPSSHVMNPESQTGTTSADGQVQSTDPTAVQPRDSQMQQ